MRSILVIRLSSLGDVILSTPVVRQLQRTYPQAILDVAVAERFSEVYSHNPRVRRVWSVDAPDSADGADADDLRLSMHESIPDRQYDLIVDLQHNVRSAALRRGLSRNVVLAPKYRLEKLALVWLKRKPATITPIVERYREPLAHLPLVLDTDGPEVWLASERADGVYAPRRPDQRAGDRLRVAIAPGAHHNTKRWPVERFAALCSTLIGQGASVALLGGSADLEQCNAVASLCNATVERADGARTLAETIAVLNRTDVLVSNDSGVMHLGAARRVPTVAIFGSTVKELGFAPYGVRHAIVDHNVGCRPCSHIGRAQCPKGHFLCMTSITVDEVAAAIERIC